MYMKILVNFTAAVLFAIVKAEGEETTQEDKELFKVVYPIVNPGVLEFD